MTAKKDAENLTPAQKAARTRAANKAAKDAAAAAESAAADTKLALFDLADVNENKVEDNVEVALDTITEVIEDDNVQATLSKVTPGIPARAREVIYTIGFYAGLVSSVAPIVAASLTGNAAIAVGTLGGIGFAFNSWLAKANLSKTSDDIAKDTARHRA